MPATSGPQYRFMEGVSHGSIVKKGLSTEKAKEFVDATPKPQRSQFMKGIRRKRG